MDIKFQFALLLHRFKNLTGKKSAQSIETDLSETWEAAKFLRNHAFPAAAGSGKTTLVAMATNKPFECKLLGLFAVGLRLSGWKVVVLLFLRRDIIQRRYMEALGFTDFVYWGDYKLGQADKEQFKLDAQEMLNQPMTFGSVKEWHYKDCWIGPNILASLSRNAHQGLPDPASNDNREQLHKILPKCLERILIAEKVMAAIKPDLMYAVEPNYWQNGPITDVAIKSDIDFIHVAGCPRDDALMIRRLSGGNRRAHPSAITVESFAAVARRPWGDAEESELDQAFAERYSGKWVRQKHVLGNGRFHEADQIKAKLGLQPDLKTAIVFSHVLWDANLFYGEDLFEDYGHWFAETIKAACKNPKLQWLIKLHPANMFKRSRDEVRGETLAELHLIEKHIGPVESLPGHVKLLYPDNEISALGLFQVADYGVTVRGTVSTEMPCFGKPVLTAGTGRAHGHGFTIDSKTREEYLNRLATLQDLGTMTAAQVDLAKRHAHAIFNLRPWLMKSFSTVYGDFSDNKQPLSQNIKLNVRSVAEIEAYGDLNQWARYASNRNQIDYFNADL